MTKLNEKRNAMARQYISQNYHEGSPAHDIATGIFIDAYDAALAEVIPMLEEMAYQLYNVLSAHEDGMEVNWNVVRDALNKYTKLVDERTINQEDIKLNDGLNALHDKYIGEK